MLAWLKGIVGKESPPGKAEPEPPRCPTEQEVDEAVDMTFPASDPVALCLGGDPPIDRHNEPSPPPLHASPGTGRDGTEAPGPEAPHKRGE